MRRLVVLWVLAASAAIVPVTAASQQAPVGSTASISPEKQTKKGQTKHGGAQPAPIKGVVRESTSQKRLVLETQNAPKR